MSYLGFESRTGEVLDRVEALCRSMTTGGQFSDSTVPPLTDVEQWLTDSYYRVAGELLRYGYGTVLSANAQALNVVGQIQALGAAMEVQLAARSGITEPDYKYQAMQGQWQGLIADYIRGNGLGELGVSRSRPAAQAPELTGRSQSRKTTVYSDSDRVPARFPSGFGRSPRVPAVSGQQVTSDDRAD